jgi:hypothetical protein
MARTAANAKKGASHVNACGKKPDLDKDKECSSPGGKGTKISANERRHSSTGKRQKINSRKKFGKKKNNRKGGLKKARRYRPGTVALREIRRYQTTTGM